MRKFAFVLLALLLFMGSRLEAQIVEVESAAALKAAIEQALSPSGKTTVINVTEPNVVIEIDNPVTLESLSGTHLTINGYSDGSTTMSGGEISRLFVVGEGSTLLMKKVKLTEGNVVDNNGGAILNGGTTMLTSCIVSGNIASNNGGAIYNSGTLYLIACKVTDNKALTGNGGAVFNATGAYAVLASSLVSGNEAGGGGSALSNAHDLSLLNTTVAGNNGVLTTLEGSAIFSNSKLTITNSIIAGNRLGGDSDQFGDIYLSATHPIRLEYSSYGVLTDTRNGGAGGIFDGNIENLSEINIEDYFVDAAEGDYQLTAESPAVNTGKTDSYIGMSLREDVAGNHRVSGGVIDRGAYENQSNLLSCTILFDLPEEILLNPDELEVVVDEHDSYTFYLKITDGVKPGGMPNVTINGDLMDPATYIPETKEWEYKISGVNQDLQVDVTYKPAVALVGPGIEDRSVILSVPVTEDATYLNVIVSSENKGVIAEYRTIRIDPNEENEDVKIADGYIHITLHEMDEELLYYAEIDAMTETEEEEPVIVVSYQTHRFNVRGEYVNNNNPEVKLNIYTSAGHLHLEAAQPVQVAIYSIQGKMAFNRRIENGMISISLPAGIYIVKTPTSAEKVVVR